MHTMFIKSRLPLPDNTVTAGQCKSVKITYMRKTLFENKHSSYTYNVNAYNVTYNVNTYNVNTYNTYNTYNVNEFYSVDK